MDAAARRSPGTGRARRGRAGRLGPTGRTGRIAPHPCRVRRGGRAALRSGAPALHGGHPCPGPLRHPRTGDEGGGGGRPGAVRAGPGGTGPAGRSGGARGGRRSAAARRGPDRAARPARPVHTGRRARTGVPRVRDPAGRAHAERGRRPGRAGTAGSHGEGPDGRPPGHRRPRLPGPRPGPGARRLRRGDRRPVRRTARRHRRRDDRLRPLHACAQGPDRRRAAYLGVHHRLSRRRCQRPPGAARSRCGYLSAQRGGRDAGDR